MVDAVFEGPIDGEPFLMLGGFDLAASGYQCEEYFFSGDARSYALDGERRPDGRWKARQAEDAPFRTRVVVRRPSDQRRFNGTVFVEWLNVTGGIDAGPDWLFAHRHIMREGAAWVGVSAQKAGIDGGGIVPGMPLKQADEPRYGELLHPGDAHAFDIFSLAGMALRRARSGPFEPDSVLRLIALGESQSAGYLVTYVNAIDPVERCFDAFLIHGRPGGAAGIDGTYVRAAPDGDIEKLTDRLGGADPVREDLRVPVLVLQSETDIVGLGSGRIHQPDSKFLRLWEIAGAAHFDTFGLVVSQVDDGSLPIDMLARCIAPTDKPLGMPANLPVNSGPQQHYIVQAALAHLERQVRDGTPMPEAPRIERQDGDGMRLARDELGIAKGGIRSPWVDAPTSVLSGEGQGGGGFAFLLGTTLELDAATLAQLYPGGPDEHLARFEAATDAALERGFILEADEEEIRELARYGRQPSGWRRID